MSTVADLVEMKVGGIVVDPKTEVPVLILRGVDDDRRYLPVFIGGLEATSIATVLANVELPRPMTHDLTMSMLAELGQHVASAVVSELIEGTFYARLTLIDADENLITLDARPSDAIALALRADAPIWVASAVLEVAGALAELPEVETHPEGTDLGDVPGNTSSDGIVDDTEDPPQQEATVFGEGVRLEDLDADDFGKYKM